MTGAAKKLPWRRSAWSPGRPPRSPRSPRLPAWACSPPPWSPRPRLLPGNTVDVWIAWMATSYVGSCDVSLQQTWAEPNLLVWYFRLCSYLDLCILVIYIYIHVYNYIYYIYIYIYLLNAVLRMLSQFARQTINLTHAKPLRPPRPPRCRRSRLGLRRVGVLQTGGWHGGCWTQQRMWLSLAESVWCLKPATL